METRFYFHLHSSDGRQIPDEGGVMISNQEDAIAYAIQIIAEMKLEAQQDYRGWSMEVTQAGRVILREPFYQQSPHQGAIRSLPGAEAD